MSCDEAHQCNDRENTDLCPGFKNAKNQINALSKITAQKTNVIPANEQPTTVNKKDIGLSRPSGIDIQQIKMPQTQRKKIVARGSETDPRLARIF